VVLEAAGEEYRLSQSRGESDGRAWLFAAAPYPRGSLRVPAVALVTRFDTPASVRDLPAGSPFYQNWHDFLEALLTDTTPGAGGATGEFYDASKVDVNVLAERSLVWMAFPREVLVKHRDDRRAAFVEADLDAVTLLNRAPQNEYCEWHVTRNATGKITKVVFVTEPPEYWERLWAVHPPTVVNLYQTLVDPAVSQADLTVPGTGNYNKRNVFNTTNGIVHLIQQINTLRDAILLSQGSVNVHGARDNYEATPPTLKTSVDPRVKFDIGALARTGLSLTLRDPIGLYITGYDDTGWTKPNGSPVDDYWRIVRGRPGQILRLEYAVPPGSGFVVGDIRIGGRRIEWGGQIAEHVTCTVAGVAGTRARA
jgi:hypothetical protein